MEDRPLSSLTERYHEHFMKNILPTIFAMEDGDVPLESMFCGMSEKTFNAILRTLIQVERPQLLENFKKRFPHLPSSHTRLPEESPEESMFRMISTKGSPELSDAIKEALDSDPSSIICGSSVLAMARAPGAERVFGDVDIFVKKNAPGVKEITDILLSQENKNIVPGMYSKHVSSPVNILLLVEAQVGSLVVQVVIMENNPKDIVADADLSCCRMFIDRDGLSSSVPQDIPMSLKDEMMFTGTYRQDAARLKRQSKYQKRGMKLIDNPQKSQVVRRTVPTPGMKDRIVSCLCRILNIYRIY